MKSKFQNSSSINGNKNPGLLEQEVKVICHHSELWRHFLVRKTTHSKQMQIAVHHGGW